MARNGSGTAIPPVSVNPVAPGTVITSNWANTTITDTYNELTNSLPRDGQAPMLAPLKIVDGSVTIPGLSFNSESASGLFRPSSGVVATTVAGIEVMRVKSNGAMLINTTTDNGTSKLQVNGDVTATSFTGAASLNVLRAGDTMTGSLGVGTAPTARLTVASTATTGELRVQGSGTNTFYGSLYKDNGSGEFRITQADGGPGMTFYTGASPTLRMTLDTSGNLGVGSATPAYTLDVRAAEPTVSVRKPAANSNFYGFNIMAGTDILSSYMLNSTTGQVNLSAGYSGWGGFITLNTNGSERLRVDANGNLLLGLISGPLGYMTIGKANAGENWLGFKDGSGNNYGAMGIPSGGGVFNVQALGTVSITLSTNGAERMRIDSNGKFMVGTSTPSQNFTFQAAGSAVMQIQSSTAGTAGAGLSLIGATTATNWLVASNYTTGGALEFIPSTAVGGGTFTTPAMRVTSAGVIQDGAGNELGYKGIPVAASWIPGQCFVTTTGQTVGTSNAGATYSIWNNSASSITLTPSGITLYQGGTTNTGNRTLLPRGMATIWFQTSTVAVINGNIA